MVIDIKTALIVIDNNLINIISLVIITNNYVDILDMDKVCI